jgi:predicted anti-sigma-YlaC factor YlaD
VNDAHNRELLGAYVLEVLDADERQTVDAHLASCAECRQDLSSMQELKASLGEVPPEAFLSGPPEDGDLLLQRTLRAVRSEQSRASRSRLVLAAASVVAVLAVAVAGGVLVGRQASTGAVALPEPSASATPAGTRTVSAADAKTGVRLAATIRPAAGWVRVHAETMGIKAGERCQLVVVDRSGTSVVAGSWLVSPQGAINGTSVDGSALVPAEDVAAVQIVTFDGEKLVDAPVV